METIHFKTVDPVAQDLLRAAASKGFELVWERFEAQQPQDGFLRTGLACPFGCMQGPCRIDPFGRGAKEGICGLGRDEMVAAFLLRLSLNGALESGAIEAAVDPAVGKAADKLGGPLTAADVSAAARMLCRPAAPAAVLLRQALRLGLLTLGTCGGGEGTAAYRIGYGLLAGSEPVIGVYGAVPAPLVAEVAAAAGKAGVAVVSLGSWADAGAQLLPAVCTSVEVEPLIASGRISLVLGGPATAAGIAGVAKAAGVPLVRWNEGVAAAEIVARAKKQAGNAVAPAVSFDGAPVAESTALRGVEAAAKELKGGKGVALLGGFDSPQQSVGWIPSEVVPALVADGLKVAGWGDAAAWMVKAGHKVPVLDMRAGLLTALKAVGADGLKGVCFVSLGGVRDVALALGLAACGVKVCAATPVPVWGSKAVMAELDGQLAALGGSLRYFDKPATADEVLAWFRSV